MDDSTHTVFHLFVLLSKTLMDRVHFFKLLDLSTQSKLGEHTGEVSRSAEVSKREGRPES